jgi:kynurenine formamidase
MTKLLYLSYILDKTTPTYGNRNRFVCKKKSDIVQGDVANDSTINTTVHIGTHLDMPYHFFQEGQTIEDFDIDYFRFEKVLFIDMIPDAIIVKDDLIALLQNIDNKTAYDILIVKTGICHKRKEREFWEKNYGFDPSIADYLRENFPNIRVIGFDSISVSSFSNRMLGRESHKAFLNPIRPILLLEDMDLTKLSENSKILKVDIVPLRISQCDGLPSTIIAEIE